MSSKVKVKSVGDSDEYSIYKKCGHHIHSYSYGNHMRKYNKIIKKYNDEITSVNMDDTIKIKVIFHVLFPTKSFSKESVETRVHDVLMSVNDDFNNYTSNPNTMNNFKYKSIVNQVFLNNMKKQTIYLGNDMLSSVPIAPSNIVFDYGQTYYYPIVNKLDLVRFNDASEVELEQQYIKQFIHNNRADSIEPKKILNIWLVDMINTSILGFSTFPWESLDNHHGIVINRRCFFPEEYGDKYFNMYKTFTHEIGHYLGLLHTFSNDNSYGAYLAVNLNNDDSNQNITGDYISDTPTQLTPTYNPVDKNNNSKLHTDVLYNPLFMNFMDYTYDKYVTSFTKKQVQKMRFVIYKYRSHLVESDSLLLPTQKFNPETETTKVIMNEPALTNENSSPIKRDINDEDYSQNQIITNKTGPGPSKYDQYGYLLNKPNNDNNRQINRSNIIVPSVFQKPEPIIQTHQISMIKNGSSSMPTRIRRTGFGIGNK
jgi:hypothetical protein